VPFVPLTARPTCGSGLGCGPESATVRGAVTGNGIATPEEPLVVYVAYSDISSLSVLEAPNGLLGPSEKRSEFASREPVTDVQRKPATLDDAPLMTPIHTGPAGTVTGDANGRAYQPAALELL